MPQHRSASLEDFLEEHFFGAEYDRIAGLLQPLINRSRLWCYALASPAELNHEDIAGAIRMVSGKSASRLEVLSRSRLQKSKGYWGMWTNAWKRVGCPLYKLVAEHYAKIACAALPRDQCQELARATDRAFVPCNGDGEIGMLHDYVFPYLGLLFAGEGERADRLEPLIRVLPLCLPLGEKKRAPGTWVVVAA